MTTYSEVHAFADQIGARRRQVESAAPSGAAAELLAATLDDLGRAEEELRVQNEALFAARTELEEEQQVFLDLFDLAPVAYFVTTADGRLLRLNHAAFALLGRPINLAVGKPLAVFVAPDDRSAFRAALLRPRLGGPVESWRMQIVPSDGEPVECRARARVVRRPPGASGAGTSGSDASGAAVLYWVITPELSDASDDLV